MSDWKSILQYMYKRQDEWMTGGTDELISELEDELGCSETELRPSINYLKRMGLIEEIEGGAIDALDLDSMLVVTESGFQLAQERELEIQQNRTNKLLVVLTAGLVATATIQALESVFAVEGDWRLVAIIAPILVFVVILILFWLWDFI